ncbi:hypothetical protein ABL78_0128 [Leptomonas seymouri]|uniref:UBA domain-containing protein n=1 Tax=Leptomonas seymouri TaxID=5684 RepID=A0A0N1I958_LEPSE|nr:hypothetical protein ABL78_0128 [Leptomonas seymouri]|eukprot:KPI90692.1 hypothetical protein ABL78_0128 [Leptomonas seymouri]
MKFTVTCLVSSVNSSLLRDAEATTMEVVVANPRATLQNLRATVAIQFRLNVLAFDLRFDHRQQTEREVKAAEAAGEGAPASSSADNAAPAVDFSDAKRLLTECGLQDGDHLTVVPKDYRPPVAAPVGEEVMDTTAGGRPAKKLRTEESGEGGLGDGDEEESFIEEDEEHDSDSDSGSSSDKAEAAAQNDLFDALRDVVPDLTVLRREFLANPQAVMERIERNHPSLFQVITQNQEMFITLMNNEHLAKAAQSMLHGGSALGDSGSGDEENSLEWSLGEEDEELDEETEAQMNALFQNYIASGGAGGDFDAADLVALEASGMEVGDVDEEEEAEGGHAKKSERDFILSRVPSEEDEGKIQALTELGFSYEQCKLAFYMCHRSIDRASNMLFEAPPEL